MGFFSALTSVFTGSGIVGSIERVALEAIETDKESAEAKTVIVKALDPNGLMRRQISRTVSRLYSAYIVLAVILLLMSAFKFGDVEGTKIALKAIIELFIPITAMFTAIVSASFGVNVSNNLKKKGVSNEASN